jgi:phenylacetate-CoA ligase
MSKGLLVMNRVVTSPSSVAPCSMTIPSGNQTKIGEAWGLAPLVRDELSDSVTLAGGPNPLGLPYARIAAVDGRSDDVITLPGAGGGRVAVHPFRLQAPSSELLEVRQYQVVHDPAPADAPARVRAALVRELRDAGAVPPPIEVTPVSEIERDPGHGAKFKLVRSVVPRG